MVSSDEQEFVGLLYDAALGRLSWQVVVERMAAVLGSQTSSLIAHDPLRDRTAILGMHCLTDDYIDVYGSSFFEHDLWTQQALRRQIYDRPALGVEVVSEDEWRRSVIYNEFLRPRTDAFHLVGGMLRLEDGGVLAIGCHRPSSVTAFTADHKARLGRLMPHLRRAVEVYQRLGDAGAVAEAARRSFDSVADGVIQLGSDGRIVQVNAAAEAILRAGDGLLRVGNRLRAVARAENVRLQSLLEAVTRMTGGGYVEGERRSSMTVSRSSAKRPYGVSVSPLGLDRIVLSRSQPAALVIVGDPEAQRPIDIEMLQELHGLTDAEARVVAGLAMGSSLREIAQARDVSINTVRTLVARAMAKTGTNTQLALVKLVLVGPAGGHWRRR